MKRQRIIAASDLKEGCTVKFEFQREGIKREGFLARFHGQVVAYENVCQHIPLSLDDPDNQFFTTEGKHFICRTHAAIYEPLTGLCVRGPCEGARLKALHVEVEQAHIEVLIEAGESDEGG